MIPIIAAAAASTAGDVIRNIANRVTNGPEKAGAAAASASVPFATILNQTNAAATAAAAAKRTQDLTTRLTQSPEVASAANQLGNSAHGSLQIESNGSVTLHTTDGRSKAVQLTEDGRRAAQELYLLRHSAAVSVSGAVGAPGSAPVTVSLS
jgi:hypothetical protein